jgi:hypothetical protein
LVAKAARLHSNNQGSIKKKRKKDSDDVQICDLKLSPHKRCHLSNQGITHNAKKRKVQLGTVNWGQSTADKCLPWMLECNKNFSALFNKNYWSRNDYDILIDKNRIGTGLFLTDNHIEWAGTLIQSKFCDIRGLLSPLLYNCAGGFPPVGPEDRFIQTIYSGGPHWLTLSNCFIPADKRGNEIDLYDSLLNFKKNQKLPLKYYRPRYGNVHSC